MNERKQLNHPQRYPVHEGEKGQVHGGECNVTRCTNQDAVFWNMGTYGFYCPSCADGINWQRHRSPLCVSVDEKPISFEAMEQLRRDRRYYELLG